MVKKRSLEIISEVDNDIPLKSRKVSKIKDKKSKINFLTNKKFSIENYALKKKRKKLPIYNFKKQFMKMLKDEKTDVIVVEGETGSGKTTQIPQWCLEWLQTKLQDKSHQVCCTQPRRVAAMSVATRVAQEMDVELGKEVGYSIRFEDMTSESTRLKYMTDGMLLREIISDRELSKYAVVILDEVHERTIANDILMGLLKQLITTKNYQQRDCTLKVIVMSATLNAAKFQQYFYAPLLKVPGSIHEVEVFYSDGPVNNYVDSAIKCAVNLHRYDQRGDILIFLNGEGEIEEACDRIRLEIAEFKGKYGSAMVLPLYSSLEPYVQQRIFQEAPPINEHGKFGRKIIISTNISETSLTIDGVVYVIDCGLSKQKNYSPETRVSSLHVMPISQASANQRAGRAGRTQPGKCFRLYSKSLFDELQFETPPEITRTNIAEVVLHLLKIGIKQVFCFDFMDFPGQSSLMEAVKMLYQLKSIDNHGNLTEFGHKLSEMPLDPQMGKMLLASIEFGCVEEILSIAAMLSVPNCFVRPPTDKVAADQARDEFRHEYGDHFALLNVYNSFLNNKQSNDWAYRNFLSGRSLKSAVDVRGQLRKILYRICPNISNINRNRKLTDFPVESISKAVLSGFYLQVARFDRKNQFTTLDNLSRVQLHPSTVFRKQHLPLWVVYNECINTDQQFLRTVTQIRVEWLLELAGEIYHPDRLTNKDFKYHLSMAHRGLLTENNENPVKSKKKQKKSTFVL